MKFLPRKIDSQFLVRVIRSEVSPEEQEYFEKWLSESDLNKEEYSSLLLVWEQMGKSNFPKIPDPEIQWEKISKRISSEETKIYRIEKSYPSHPVNRRNPHKVWLIRAAAIIIISLISIISFNNLANKEVTEPEPAFISNLPSEIVNYELVAQKGQKITFPLSDGTIIYLNSDSKLIYPKYFADDSRELEVIGEAYFSVKPDKKRPFKVKSGQITTLVTGTEFNVLNRSNRIEVAVASGTVKVMSSNSSRIVELTKGEKVSAAYGKIHNPVSADLKFILAWRENKLAFSNTSLAEIMAEIERVYNVSVFFKNDSVKTRTLTGIFETRSLEQILSLINLTLDISIKQQGLTVIVE